MKKTTTIMAFLAVALCWTTASAQDASFGITGGPAVNTVLADNSDYKDAVSARTLYSVGLQLDYEFHEVVSIAPELLFSRRGWHSEFDAGIASAESEWRISYLELPLLVRIGLPLFDTVAPKLLLGPHAALFIDGQVDGDSQIFGFSGSDTDDISSDDVNDLQFGVTAGAGVDVNFDEFILTSDIRYMRNFTGIFETDDSDDDNIYHTSWSLMIGVLY